MKIAYYKVYKLSIDSSLFRFNHSTLNLSSIFKDTLLLLLQYFCSKVLCKHMSVNILIKRMGVEVTITGR